jgi:hypothetical protein
MDANDTLVRIVEIGRAIAISDDLVVTVTPHSKGKVKLAFDRAAGCGVALMSSRIGKGNRPGKPTIRRMD